MAELRDWKRNPPKNREEGFALAFDLAQSACDGVRRKLGYGPRPVRTETGYDIVWPDGEVTNCIDVEMIQRREGVS